MACLTKYQEKTVFQIYNWCCEHGVYDVEKVKKHAKRYRKGWYEFLLDSYNYDIMHAYLAYDEAMHFCDGCVYNAVMPCVECNYCSRCL